jgi:hypothetical protein
MAGFNNEVVYGSNVDFSGAIHAAPTILTNGQLIIGTTALNVGGTHINIGQLTSPNSTITIGYSSPNITLSAAATIATTYQADSGTATPALNILNVLGGPGIVTSGSGNTITINSFSYQNLGISYNAGTGVFTVLGGNGSALSASNPGFVFLQSKTAGLIKKYTITANQSFIDDNGASQIIGNLFGLTAGIAQAFTVPFFIYAVADDTETTIAFMISRYPNSPISPVAAKIGKSGSAVADNQGSFFSLANITVADYESNPCLSIGSFRMTMSTLNDWTVTTLTNQDGIGQFQDGQEFFVSLNQFGAASGSHFYANGGTAPQFTNNAQGYYISLDNFVKVFGVWSVVTVNGAGGVALLQAIPYLVDGSCVGCGNILDNAGNVFVTSPNILAPPPTNKIQFYAVTNGAAGGYTNGNVSGAGFGLNSFITGFISFVS